MPVRSASTLAAKAAARVAERYAKAPRYSDLLAGEARAEIQAAEAASRAPLEPQAAPEFVLAAREAGFEAGPIVETPSAWDDFFSDPVPTSFVPAISHLTVSSQTVSEQTVSEQTSPEPASERRWETSAEPAQFASAAAEEQSFKIRWESDLPRREATPTALHESHGAPAPSGSRIRETGSRETGSRETGLRESGSRESGTHAENWWQSSANARDAHRFFSETDAAQDVEPAQPLHVNLIEFPRELVATRKIRPRLAEGPLAATGRTAGQLSIFEVDPGTVSIQPTSQVIETVSAADWAAPDWAAIKLDEHPSLDIELEDDPLPAPVVLLPASISLRLMATVMDLSLVAGAFFAAAMLVMNNAESLPTLKQMEPGAIMGLVAILAVYQMLFFAFGSATPGMRWAHISLHTLEGARPTRGQRCARMFSFLLSLLPVGLGVAWSIFDEDHLSWHDRLSKTYLKKS